ncbi:MAG: 4-hydroxythreonine-4-phosphate dehydrogenase PdxA, partial [Nannocystaceae bacterium]
MSATSPARRVDLAVTQGDPRGIGPELILRACAASQLGDGDRIFARRDVLEGVARGGADWAVEGLARAESLLAPPEIFARSAGPEDPASQVEALEAAADAMNTSRLGGLVTAPIEKLACREAGFRFPGHTEFLATSSGAESFAMCLVGPSLRVALVTIHVPLREVAARVDAAAVISVGRLLGESL